MQKEQMKKLLFSFLPEIHEKNLIHEFPAGEGFNGNWNFT